MANDLRDQTEHFAFGENWKSFAGGITQATVDSAVEDMRRLFPDGELDGVSFLDIGCGSGLSMLAAKQLGADRVTGVDLDPNSAATATELLSRWLPAGTWEVRRQSVFDLAADRDGLYDVVYSWGVLHHTGDMWPALRQAASLVKPGGHLAVALYRRSPLCGLWTLEKRLYASSGAAVQAVIRSLYKAAYLAGLRLTGRRPSAYIAAYEANRGMDWHHDVHDWLGGYPYESATPEEVAAALQAAGFSMLRMREKPVAAKGLFGSHCDEFVAVRRS